MANEDSRENSVVGSALKIAAVGGALYAGGRTGLKYKDVLGGTGVGKAIRSGIDDMAEGSLKTNLNKARGMANNAQDTILKKDIDRSIKQQDKLLNIVDKEMSKGSVDSLHSSYKGSASDRRNIIKETQVANQGIASDLIQGRTDTVVNSPNYVAKGTRESANNTSTSNSDGILQNHKKIQDSINATNEEMRAQMMGSTDQIGVYGGSFNKVNLNSIGNKKWSGVNLREGKDLEAIKRASLEAAKAENIYSGAVNKTIGNDKVGGRSVYNALNKPINPSSLGRDISSPKNISLSGVQHLNDTKTNGL